MEALLGVEAWLPFQSVLRGNPPVARPLPASVRTPWHFLLALLPFPRALFQQMAGPWHRVPAGGPAPPTLFLPPAGGQAAALQFCLTWK